MIKQFCLILKMHEMKFRFYEIKNIENDFINDINQQNYTVKN